MPLDHQLPASVDGAVPPIILLVEDDADTRDMYSVFLESAGMWVATAPNPGAAASAIAELKPDVIVTDLGFDGKALGLDFAHAIKADPATAHIPVVLLTGRSADDLPVSARSDTDLLLVKPVRPDDLAAQLTTLLQRSRVLRARHESAARRAAQLVEKSHALFARARELDSRVNLTNRRCPACGETLQWIETGQIDGAEYDYYHWCERGCGLHCFDRQARRWVKLAG